MNGSRRPRIVATNHGSTPEAGHGAAALAKAGLLSRYHVPIAFTEKQERMVRRLPNRVAAPMLRELRRRALPSSIPSSAVSTTAAIPELRRVLAARRGRSKEAHDRLWYRQLAAFDSAVAEGLGPADGGLYGIAGAAVRSLRRAGKLSVPTVLDCPMGHYGAVRSEMRREAALAPDYAGTLQVHDFRDQLIADHLEELERADVVMALCSYAKRVLSESGVEESKVAVILPGVDLELFRPRERIPDGIFRVLFVGQITQRKGLSYLLDAFEAASIERSELHLVGPVIGTSDPWIGRAGVVHHPPVPRAELIDHYRRADVFVLPSLAEGFGLTALEAMASGLPVILSTNTFADDIVTDGEEGYIVPVRDSAAIAERLVALAGDPDGRAAAGSAARERAEDLPWSRFGEAFVDLMRNVGRAPEAAGRDSR